jgi:Protein involved in ribonucleotide reduction
MARQLLYWSSTGITERLALRLGGDPLRNYAGDEFILMVPSYGAARTGQHVPRPVKRFLAEHSDQMVGVVGVGNITFGPEFCLGAVKISERFGVPLLASIDIVPTQDQIKIIRKELGC